MTEAGVQFRKLGALLSEYVFARVYMGLGTKEVSYLTMFRGLNLLLVIGLKEASLRISKAKKRG